MHYIKDVIGVNDVIYLLIAILLYSIVVFIKHNRLLLKTFFKRKKNFKRLKGRGVEAIETMVRYIPMQQQDRGEIYHVISIQNKVWSVEHAALYGGFFYSEVKACVLFKNGIIICVAVEDQHLYDAIIKDFQATFKNTFVTIIGVLLAWMLIRLKTLVNLNVQ